MPHRFTRSYLLLLTLAVVGLAPTAQAQSGPGEPGRGEGTRIAFGSDQGTTIDTTIPFTRSGGVVDLSLVSGEIKVTGWSRADAHIHVTSEDAPVRVELGSDRILLDTYRGRHHDDNEVRYQLSVPTGTRVIMHSMSGDLETRGTHGEIEAAR